MAQTHLRIPKDWQIELRLVAPQDLPQAYAQIEWAYLPNHQYRLSMRHTLTREEMEWAAYHELLELLLGAYGDFVEEWLGFASEMYPGLPQQHRKIRDEFIEHLCRVLLGRERPRTMLAL